LLGTPDNRKLRATTLQANVLRFGFVRADISTGVTRRIGITA
jgi:hypothetical protein